MDKLWTFGLSRAKHRRSYIGARAGALVTVTGRLEAEARLVRRSNCGFQMSPQSGLDWPPAHFGLDYRKYPGVAASEPGRNRPVHHRVCGQSAGHESPGPSVTIVFPGAAWRGWDEVIPTSDETPSSNTLLMPLRRKIVVASKCPALVVLSHQIVVVNALVHSSGNRRRAYATRRRHGRLHSPVGRRRLRLMGGSINDGSQLTRQTL